MTAPAAPPPPPPPRSTPASPPSGPAKNPTGEPKWARQLRTLRPDKPWMRWVWVLLGASFAIPVILLGAFQLVTLLAHEEEMSSLTFDAAEVDALDVSVSVGHIVVVGTDADEITVTANVSRGLTTTKHSEQIVDGVLELRSSCNHFLSKFCSVDYTIELPKSTPVVVRSDHSNIDVSGLDNSVTASTDNGDINVRGSSGAMDLRSDNGAIVAEIEYGSLLAHTDNGSIRAIFLSAPDQVIATTDNGSIGITVPETEPGYAVHASSDNGAVNVDATLHVSSTSPHTVTAHSDNGSVNVRHR